MTAARPDPVHALTGESASDPEGVAPHGSPEHTRIPPTEPSPVPDPFDDVDALEELAGEIVTPAAHLHAAAHRLLVLIRDFDRRRGWELGGHRSMAH